MASCRCTTSSTLLVWRSWKAQMSTASSLRSSFRLPVCHGTHNDVYLLPKEFDEKVAKLHYVALRAELTVVAQEQAVYIGVKIDVPFKGGHHSYWDSRFSRGCYTETPCLILESTLVDPASPGTSEPGHITSPVHAPTNWGPNDSLGDFFGDQGTTANTTTPDTQRESKGKQETLETRTRHIPVSCFPSVERPSWSGNSNLTRTAQPSDKRRR